MKKAGKFLSYVLVAVLASAMTLGITLHRLPDPVAGYSKLDQLSDLIDERFIEGADRTAVEDAAAYAMIESLGDRWSYYITAADYASYQEQMSNSYVGVGITIQMHEGDGYLDVVQVIPGGPADQAGVQVGDVLIAVDGKDCAESTMDETRNLVRGEEGSTVSLTLRRQGQERTVEVTRAYFEMPVVASRMLDGNVGYIQIKNFDERCAEETIAAIDALMAEGAEYLLFDVRNNPGGYKNELVKVLDYLLPEGPLFRSEYYDGSTHVDESGPEHLDIPMAVMVNSESYSAAEFFAAAIREYEAGFVVGQQTFGKGYFQQTYPLVDGSAVGLSVGKYFTPHGESLIGKGIVPDVSVEVDEETFARIYYGTLNPEEDPQILAGIDALKSGNQA